MKIRSEAALVIFGGLPGTGKTTLARALAGHLKCTYLRIDTIEQALLRQDGLKLGSEGYSLAYAIAEENLLIRNTVIADSVNPLPVTRNAWRAIAERNGARSIEIEVVCSDRTQHQYRVESREADIPGHKMPTWQEIIDREYRWWETKDLVIDTADQTKEEAFQKLLQNLGDLL